MTTNELCELFGITPKEIHERRAFLCFTPEDEENLKKIHLLLQEEAEAIVAEFYDHLTRFGELKRFLSDPRTLARLKTVQREYLLSLGQQADQPAYIEDRLCIGVTHERVGLNQKWYLDAYALLFGLIGRRIAARHAGDGSTLFSILSTLQKTLTLDSTLAVETYYQATTQRLESILHQSAEAHHTLQEVASLDSLTQVKNRKSLMEALELEFYRSQRFRHPFTILFVDIDQFKPINDQYGHAAGDVVLQKIAQLIADATRPADILGRYGGEEFVVGLVETDETTAKEIAERIRLKIALTSFELGQHTVSITISIGLATLSPNVRRIGDLIERADRALYRAKEAGRNQVWMFKESDA